MAAWEEGGVQVHTTTRSFQDAFDDDDSLTYDPEYTGALVLSKQPPLGCFRIAERISRRHSFVSGRQEHGRLLGWAAAARQQATWAW